MPNRDPDHYVDRNNIPKIETTPIAERYNVSDLKEMIELLNKGYELDELNNFVAGENKEYETTLVLNRDKKTFRHKYPIKVTLPGKDMLNKQAEPSNAEVKQHYTEQFKKQLITLINNIDLPSKE